MMQLRLVITIDTEGQNKAERESTLNRIESELLRLGCDEIKISNEHNVIAFSGDENNREVYRQIKGVKHLAIIMLIGAGVI